MQTNVLESSFLIQVSNITYHVSFTKDVSLLTKNTHLVHLHAFSFLTEITLFNMGKLTHEITYTESPRFLLKVHKNDPIAGICNIIELESKSESSRCLISTNWISVWRQQLAQRWRHSPVIQEWTNEFLGLCQQDVSICKRSSFKITNAAEVFDVFALISVLLNHHRNQFPMSAIVVLLFRNHQSIR